MSEVDVLKITNEDAAFILGKGGRTSNAPPQAATSQPTPLRTCDHEPRRLPTPVSSILRVNPHAEEKIARVSGADLDLFEHSLTLEIRGTEDERNRAKKYVECVMAQRVGPVHIEEDDGEDLTTIMVPSEAVGFVTGSQALTHP